MSLETGKRALDFLIENSGDRTNLEVDFFGGEPLMNWEVVKQLVEYARVQEKKHRKNFRFTLTTNGMLIDEDVIDFADRQMSNVVLSLDGRKEIHEGRQGLLYQRHLYSRQSGLHQGRVPHGRPWIYTAEHGTGRCRRR